MMATKRRSTRMPIMNWMKWIRLALFKDDPVIIDILIMSVCACVWCVCVRARAHVNCVCRARVFV